MSSMVGPHIMAAAATASVTALRDENLYPKETFDGEEFFAPNGFCPAASATSNHEAERLELFVSTSHALPIKFLTLETNLFLTFFLRILNNEDPLAKERPAQSGTWYKLEHTVDYAYFCMLSDHDFI